MSLVLEQFLDEEVAPEELVDMGSFNHGYLQLRLGSYFLNQPKFTPSSAFSLDISVLSKAEFESKMVR